MFQDEQDFVGAGKRLDDIDLPRIGAQIGVEEDEIHAVLDVETRGGGFDAQGRPKMLFEPHIFYRRVRKDQRDQAVRAGLAYKRWGTKRYPRDSYPRLIAALQIDYMAALESASWGLGQIMGFNCKAAGYPTAEDMVKAFLDDEETHLEAMISFIEANGLDDELRGHDWRGFARGYNGPGYAKNRYDAKLREAFEKWQRIPDTPFQIDRDEVDPNDADGVPDSDEEVFLAFGMQSDDVKTLQRWLDLAGFDVGEIDGIFGFQTRGAVLDAQKRMSAPITGEVNTAFWNDLDDVARAVLAETSTQGLEATYPILPADEFVIGSGTEELAQITHPHTQFLIELREQINAVLENEDV